jgi:hypothetical protein
MSTALSLVGINSNCVEKETIYTPSSLRKALISKSLLFYFPSCLLTGLNVPYASLALLSAFDPMPISFGLPLQLLS